MTTSSGARGAGIPKAWLIGCLTGCAAIVAIAVVAAAIVGVTVKRRAQPAAESVQEPSGEDSPEPLRRDQPGTSSAPSSSQSAVAGSRSFAIGDRVEIEASQHWVPCVVAENEPDSVMRLRCEAYPALSRDAGSYIVDRDNPTAVRHATGEVGQIRSAPAAPARQADPAGLKVGEYACYGSGGRAMAGLAFKVLSGNRYGDLDGAEQGTFAISDTTVRFSGGHLDGQVGRDLRGHSFTIGAQAECEPY